ncbi:MAG TPA: mechanosensitive ion channel domain-containing protein [Terracidiphilus sp.]|nr:mechanosensitive ion channel domain-containing protein [Terracidiphilus sp.]
MHPNSIVCSILSGPFLQFVGKNQTVQIGGVKLLGANYEDGRKLLLTLGFIAVLYLLNRILRFLAEKLGGTRQLTAFWTRQGISIAIFFCGILGLASIWFNSPARFAEVAGMVGAGLAFAMQKVVTSFAGYFVILRGKTFNIGDRIRMGGVRGDVIALNFIQTVVMEMGEPQAGESDDPGMWVHSRQYSGRIVTISNSEIFEQPVYNYTREFPYIWEEMHVPIAYRDDRHRAEQIMLEAVARNTTDIANMAEPELTRVKEHFFIEAADIHPRVYLRITSNWAELTVRFLCRTHEIRKLKDRISREILVGLEQANIGIASGTYEIVGVPPIRVEPAAPVIARRDNLRPRPEP